MVETLSNDALLKKICQVYHRNYTRTDFLSDGVTTVKVGARCTPPTKWHYDNHEVYTIMDVLAELACKNKFVWGHTECKKNDKILRHLLSQGEYIVLSNHLVDEGIYRPVYRVVDNITLTMNKIAGKNLYTGLINWLVTDRKQAAYWGYSGYGYDLEPAFEVIPFVLTVDDIYVERIDKRRF